MGKIVTNEEIHQIDQIAMKDYGIPSLLLMENAGRSAIDVIRNVFPNLTGKQATIICGSGNNGGDGLVIARQLNALGAKIRVVRMSDRSYEDAARVNLDSVARLKIPVLSAESIHDWDQIFNESDLIIDAIFGSGLTREVTGTYAQVIEQINRSGKWILSVDIPSGINGNNGEVMGVAVKANATVAMGLPKFGNLLYPGFEYNGQLSIASLTMPPDLFDHCPYSGQTNDPLPIAERDPSGHKGTFGQALFIAGAAAYFGAPYLAAMSFLKAGGGYSRLAAPYSICAAIAANGPEIVFIPQTETRQGSLARSNAENLLKISGSQDFVVVGPGLSLNAETQSLVHELIPSINKPLLIDGDALTGLAAEPEILKTRTAATILTPHLGEFSRLTKISIEELHPNRIPLLKAYAQKWNATIVLKGAHTIIASPQGELWVNLTGNSGMGTAGSGDVLSGAIAALFGLGLNPIEAARMGVYVHGLAGDIAADQIGMDGITATTIMNALPEAMRQYRQRMDETDSPRTTSLQYIK